MTAVDVKAQRFARNLSQAIEGFIACGYCGSIRDFARKVDIPHTVILGYIAGKTWVDGQSLAKLEAMTGWALWDSQPRQGAEAIPPFVSGAF